MPIDTWFHMAVVQDASLLHLYINGVQLASTGLGALYPPATTWIGSPNVAKTVSLDEVRLSETARSLDWVRLDYLTQKSTITTTTPSVQIAGARRK